MKRKEHRLAFESEERFSYEIVIIFRAFSFCISSP